MKPEELKNYCLKLTKSIKRFYYSDKPLYDKNSVEYFDIIVGNAITSRGMGISELIKDGNNITGISIKYYDEDDNKVKTEIVTPDKSTKIRLISGNPDRYFIYDYTLQIVMKS